MQSIKTLAVMAVFGTTLATPSFASETPVTSLDQSYEVTPAGANGWSISRRTSQTFTAGISGQLDSVGVQAFQSDGGTSGDLWVEIWTVDPTGVPLVDASDGENALAAVLVPNHAIPYSHDINDTNLFVIADFSSENLDVVAGDQYAIMLRRTDLSNPDRPPWMIWRGGSSHSPDEYAGGSFYLYSSGDWVRREGSDLGFQTYVTVPEPSSVVLLGLLAVIACRRRRR